MTTLPVTEQENPATTEIDKVSTLDALRLINAEDEKVAQAVERVLPEIALTIDKIVRAAARRWAAFLCWDGYERTARRARPRPRYRRPLASIMILCRA